MNRKRAGCAAATAVALLVTGVLATAVTSASAAGQVTATFSHNGWGSGYEGRYLVTNGGDQAITRWTVAFDLPSGSRISSFWNAEIAESGGHYTAVDKGWNGNLAPGASASFGFIVQGQGTPTNCTVNGAPCGGGPRPTNEPTPTPTATPTPTPSPTGTPTSTPTPTPTPTTSPQPGGNKILGYFVQWGVYGRNYHVKNVHTSGAAARLTHINYAFGNVTNGQCSANDDTFADYDKAYSAADSVDGTADSWDPGALRGNFGQLRKLKKMYPRLKVLWSFGGWTWSGGFGQAARNPQAFADSCYRLVEDPRWADVFDGIDIDWEYPGTCGLQCDTSDFGAYRNLMAALRARFGQNNLVTAAITADGSAGGKLDKADYGGAARHVDWYNVMNYDYFGGCAAQGPTAPHSALRTYPGIPQPGFDTDSSIQKLKGKGVPASKLLLGIGFYGRGWTGVSQQAPGGSATGPAPVAPPGEAGIKDYKFLKNDCPANGEIAGTAYAHCGNEWWSYDTPRTIGGKMGYARGQGLGGAFFWELSGDTVDGELIRAMRGGLG